jgi:hypothetical protein
MLLALSKTALGSQIRVEIAVVCVNLGEVNMRIEKAAVAVLLLGASTLALAKTYDAVTFVPEPETLALVAGAAVAWAIVRWTKRK